MTAKKILIIDDDESLRLLVAYALKVEGYLISMAADGAAGLAQIRHKAPDAVICDVVMPGMDGFEVLHNLRAGAATASLPVVLLASAGDREQVRLGAGASADDVLAKPINPEELIASLRTVLQLRSQPHGAQAAAPPPDQDQAPTPPGEGTGAFLETAAEDGALALGKRAGDKIRVRGYRVLSQVGEGGMSQVFLADDLAHERRVVLKLLKARRKEDERMVRRFFEESAVLLPIRHEHVVRVYDQGIGEGMAYIAMEYLEGGSLRDLMDQGMQPEQALSMLAQAARGVAEIHRRGIVHRDIKPSNLMLRADGVLVLTDFGVAKRGDSADGRTIRGEILGTPHYMSPEQAQSGEVGPAADIYSLGAIFFEMLTGRRLYPGETVIEVLSQQTVAPIPRLAQNLARFQPLVDGMLAKHASDRYASAETVLAEVERLRGEPGTQPAAVSSDKH